MVTPFLQFAAEEKSGIAVLGVDPLALLLQLATFGILFLLLRKFAFKAIVGKLEERRKTIDAGVELGREMEAEKQKLDEKVQQVLHKARAEADKIIAAGHEEAAALLKEAEATAARKTDVMLADARAKIDEDIERAREDLVGDMRVLVAEATETILGEKLDSQKDSILLDKALKGVRRP